jgi:hypothetical protein
MKILSASETIKISAVAKKLNVPAEWLFNLLRFESGFDPAAKNPRSSARGLIQFTNSTAQNFGFDDSAALVRQYPDFSRQLEKAVYPYLRNFAPFPTRQALYMSVFYPAFRYVSPDTFFSPDIRAVNPGIARVQDYIDRVDGRAIKNASGLLALVALGFAVYFLTKGKK